MRAVSSLLLSLGFIPACVAQLPMVAHYENLPGVSLYSNGYLLSWDSEYHYTQFTLYGRNAKPAFSAPERTGSSSPIMWAVDADGVVASAYRLPHLPEGRIDLLNPAGNVTGMIDAGSYIPQQIVFAPDHTIWTASYDARNETSKGGPQDFNVLHHYARSGEELGQALPYSQTGGDPTHPVVENPSGLQLLFIANDRIGWNGGLHRGARTWVEVSFSGVLLGKYDLKTTDGLALGFVVMTASGKVYARIVRSHSAESAHFAVLDRSKGTWQKVVGDPGGMLIGSEGDSLVFLQIDAALGTLRFVPSSSLRVEEPPQQ